jgi:quinol monooxygenase YgiN
LFPAHSTPEKNFCQSAKPQLALELRAGLAYFSFMFIIHVHVQVKPDCLAAFQTATLLNARLSLLELGILRFDVVQRADDPTRFVLVEVYRTAAANAAHKETSHYQVWRDTVAPMMAAPRTSVKFHNLFPDDQNWRA